MSVAIDDFINLQTSKTRSKMKMSSDNRQLSWFANGYTAHEILYATKMNGKIMFVLKL